MAKRPVSGCFKCHYASLNATGAACLRCGYTHTTKKARAQVTKVFDGDDES